jgi:hypothetical protein
MGRRDFRHREPKKTKKESKKISPADILPPPVTVGVVKKGKKKRESEEE